MVEDPKFNDTVLTNIGHKMLTSLASGNKKITYTKAEAYTQDVSSIDNNTLQALTSLQGKELSANLLVSNDNGNGNVVTITANFENKGLTSDAVFSSVGWFAKLDTDDTEHGITANQEYLIGITPANGAQTLVAPPADQSASQAISLNLNMTLSDAASVNMTVSDAGAVHFNQLDDQLANYTTTSDLTKLLAGKADLGLSYTKAELDAKLLDLTTDTNGKVSADQVKALISDKANISDVYTKTQIDSALSTRDTQINTKANASDVYTKSQIDSDFSARDAQINTKANTSDVYTKSDVDSALAADRGRLGKLEGAQTVDSPDFNTITATGVYYITNNTPANIKNNPASQWGVLVVANGNGNRTSQVYYPDDGSPQWCRLLNGSNWLPWYQLSTKNDVSNAVSLANKAQDTANQANTKAQNALDNKADKTTVEENLATKANQSDLDKTNAEVAKKADSEDVTSQINNATNLANQAQTTANTKANSADVYTKTEVDSKTSGTVVTAYDVASKKPTTATNSYTSEELVDQGALGQFADQINQLKGRRLADSVDCNTLTDTGIYLVENPFNGKNFPSNDWGTLTVFNGLSGSDTRITQIFVDDNGTSAFMRISDGTTWKSWNQIAWTSDVTNLQNTVNSKVNVDGDLFLSPGSINSWADVQADGNKNVLRSVRTEGTGTDFNTGNYDAGILFGGNDTKALISVGYTGNQARVTGGNNSAVWHEDIAWKSDITSLQNTINNIDSTRTPIVNGASGDDLFSFKTNQIRLYNSIGKTCKNLPPASNTQWFTVQYVFEAPNDNGIAIYRTPWNEIWTVGCNGGSYTYGSWTRVANSTDITNLQNTINQQSQTIQSLTTRLTNAENEISYIKANYIEGKQFPASQEAQATAWENANPQGIAFITSN